MHVAVATHAQRTLAVLCGTGLAFAVLALSATNALVALANVS